MLAVAPSIPTLDLRLACAEAPTVTERVSVDSVGEHATGSVAAAPISGDGRFVVLVSCQLSVLPIDH